MSTMTNSDRISKAKQSTHGVTRALMQTCTLEKHERVYGDINFDCKFEFVSDLVAMSEIFGEWNPDLDNFPQRKPTVSTQPSQ